MFDFKIAFKKLILLLYTLFIVAIAEIANFDEDLKKKKFYIDSMNLIKN